MKTFVDDLIKVKIVVDKIDILIECMHYIINDVKEDHSAKIIETEN